MTLHLIGLGLSDEKDITLRGLEAVKSCEVIYLENYTNVFCAEIKSLEKLFNKKIIAAGRKLVEESDEIINEAKNKDVAFLVIGDPMIATTHTDLLLRARKEKVICEIIHNASVISAVAETGLQIYKFGKTASIPFPEKSFEPENFYDVIKENKKINAHTLLLLDLRSEQKRFMTVNEAVNILLKIEERRKEGVFTEETLCVGCARLGSMNRIIRFGKAKKIANEKFGEPPHCLIVPARLHFVEEEALKSPD